MQVTWIIFLNINATSWISAVWFAREWCDHPCRLECINSPVIRIFPRLEMSLCKVLHILELYLQFYTHRMRVEVFTWFTCRHPTQWVSMDNNEWEKASVQLNSCSFACSCTWCELVAVLRTCRTWWHPWLTCLVVRDWDPPAASDMNFHSWN